MNVPNISCGHCVMTIERELAEMEPESKWPVATLARLCAEVGTEEAERERVESLRRLEGLDPMRRGYYCDCCESLR